MDISELTFRLLIIFFPGIIAHLIVDSLTEHRERTSLQIFLYSFVLGIFSYLLLWLCSSVIKSLPSFDIETLLNLTKDKGSINFAQIVWATILAIPLSLIVSLLLYKKIIHRIARVIKVSKQFGDLDVWDYTFNAPEVEWVTVRDIKNNLSYQGWLVAFSSNYKENELLLKEVKVYQNDTGQELYSIDALYLTREPNDLTIELSLSKEEN